MGSVDHTSTSGGGMGDLSYPRGGRGNGGGSGGRGRGGGHHHRGGGGGGGGGGDHVSRGNRGGGGGGYQQHHQHNRHGNNGNNNNSRRNNEPAGYNNYYTNELMQQGQGVQGGGQGQGQGGGDEVMDDQQLAEQIALSEQLQAHKQHGKKVSLNHLLRFTLVEREAPQPVRRTRKTASTPFKKETFLHANYRFIVSAGGDYSDNIANPDKAVAWENIEQVFFNTDSESEYHCPICLDKPVAAKVSRCGHVFCWGCIIHHLSYTKGAGQCPLCFDWMLIKDMKSVVIETSHKFELNDSISFSLLQRSEDATVPRLKAPGATPALTGADLIAHHRLPAYTDTGAEFCRLAVANDITSILAREWAELTEAARLAASAQDESLPYLTSAQDALRERAEKAHINFSSITSRSARSQKNRSHGNNSSSGLKLTTSSNGNDSGSLSTSSSSNNIISMSVTEPSNIPTTTATPVNATESVPTPIDTTTKSTTPVEPTPQSTPETSEDLWGWEEHPTDSNSTSTTPTASTTSTISTPTTTSTSTPASTSPTSQSKPAQITLLHSSFDHSHIPPSILSPTPTTPTGTSPTSQNADSNSASTSSTSHSSAHHDNLTQETPSGLYYFYQVQEGQTAYLHPLCVRVLTHEYRSFDALPLVIRGSILDYEEVVQTDKTRKQFRHLSHLPVTCKFMLLYIDLAPLVSQRTLSFFAEDLRKIKQNREKRLRLERQKKIEKEREEREDQARVKEKLRERQVEMELLQESFTPLTLATASPPSATPPPVSSSPTQQTDSGSEQESKPQPGDDEDEGISFAQALMGAKPKRRRPKPRNPNNNPNPNPNPNPNTKSKKKGPVLLFSNSGTRGHY